MSVMACGRSDCEHIMCNILVLNGSAYLCFDCFEELEQFKDTWPERISVRQAERLVRHFMGTEPGTYLTEGPQLVSRDEAFKEVTR
jgi:hypothetical protein